MSSSALPFSVQTLASQYNPEMEWNRPYFSYPLKLMSDFDTPTYPRNTYFLTISSCFRKGNNISEILNLPDFFRHNPQPTIHDLLHAIKQGAKKPLFTNLFFDIVPYYLANQDGVVQQIGPPEFVNQNAPLLESTNGQYCLFKDKEKAYTLEDAERHGVNLEHYATRINIFKLGQRKDSLIAEKNYLETRLKEINREFSAVDSELNNLVLNRLRLA